MYPSTFPPQPIQDNLERKPRNDSISGLLWTVLAILSFAGAVLLFVAGALSSWRATPEVTYHVLHGSTPSANKFYSSYYGLYFLTFNSGGPGIGKSKTVSRTWNQHQVSACHFFTSSNTLPLFQRCSAACQRHLNTRCSVYHKLRLWGYITLGTLMICGCFVFLGSICAFVFSPQHSLLTVTWLGSSILSFITSTCWIWISGSSFSSLQLESQYPYPKLSTSIYIVYSGIFLIFVCGVSTFVLGYCADRDYWHFKQQEVNKRVLGSRSPSNPGAIFNHGLMTTLSQPKPPANQFPPHTIMPYGPLFSSHVPSSVAYPNGLPPAAVSNFYSSHPASFSTLPRPYQGLNYHKNFMSHNFAGPKLHI